MRPTLRPGRREDAYNVFGSEMALRPTAATVLLCLCHTVVAEWRDPSPHRIQFVTVDEGVRLEVLDWGGTGRPVVLLAGSVRIEPFEGGRWRLRLVCCFDWCFVTSVLRSYGNPTMPVVSICPAGDDPTPYARFKARRFQHDARHGFSHPEKDCK